MKSRVLSALALGALVGTLAPASAAQYVLTASNWGSKQSAAVASAGGSVVFSHGKAGIAVVSSDAPDFLAAAMASQAFQTGAPDEVHEWQAPVPVQEVVGGSDETFYNAQWAPKAMEADVAWANGCNGAGVRVAILDGGIHSTHIDLDGNLDTACSVSFVAGQNFNQDVGTFWHGTHVAGIVAAEDNGIGTIGIAPSARLMGVKVLHNGSGSFGAIIGGLLYAADPAAFGLGGCQRADIVNMSLGATFPRNAANGGGQSLVAALNKAVNYAIGNGVLVVTSAGNGATDLGQAGNVIKVPAQSGGALAVTATGPMGFALGATDFRRPASYSDYGEDVVTVAGPGGDFVLPGSAICSLSRIPSGTVTNFCWVFDMVMSTVRGGAASVSSYGWAAGTSMAAPAVSGAAALILQNNPGMSVGALKSRLAQTADDEGKVGKDEFYGRGFVNARRACSE